MSNILRQAVETRRKEIINKLITFNVYKKDDKHLYELSLSKLEHEYKKIQAEVHPHSEFGSIHWTTRKR
ncbi:Fur-regulated basic protein FbpA [Bacillaceae bacterium Marseille-Q3522]|nr:Fur-regulated basic protein FbpA [Bacillaceae bacterium Marseille-Q3522]